MLPTPRAAEEASEIMMRFAERTGLASDLPEQRYLWTDAFAVCNFLGLAQVTGEERFANLALRLVNQVHHVLGRFRADDSRTGWISGLSEREGETYPTRGGLRIGKALPERGVSEPFDEQLEWRRDGQYFHYSTKWMQALDQVCGWTGQPRFNTWARELAEVSHDAFTLYGSKRSTDGLEDECRSFAPARPFHGAPRSVRWFHCVGTTRNDEVDAIGCVSRT